MTTIAVTGASGNLGRATCSLSESAHKHRDVDSGCGSPIRR